MHELVTLSKQEKMWGGDYVPVGYTGIGNNKARPQSFASIKGQKLKTLLNWPDP